MGESARWAEQPPREYGNVEPPRYGGSLYGHRPPLPPLGGRWRRLFAGLVDAFLVNLLVAPLVGMSGVATTVFDRSKYLDFAEYVFSLELGWLVAAAVVWFLYYWLLTAFWRGQTVGKKVFDLRVTTLRGTPVTPSMAGTRVFVGGLFLVFGLTAIDLICILFSGRKQALHDKAAVTVVVAA